uniref:START domain-containing protein n=1 Tax=Oryza meridionalis TaxID=40149 RepID=A0A0E0C804_9ORYZ
MEELKDLRSQLHQAADCCEKAFLDTEKKKLILESTKGYICDAIVAVIDHLGTVSSKLEQQLQEKIEITQTEKKLNFLKQLLEEPKRKMVLTPGRERSVATTDSESPTTDAKSSFSFRAEAGVFGRKNGPAASGGDGVEEGDEEVQAAGEAAVEISSENAGPGCSQSQSGGGSGEDGGHDDDDGEGSNKKRRRKNYHRHTAEQIRIMEALFKESPHPDERQRQQAVQERHENSLLKSELEKLQDEHRAMRELAKKPSRCPNCGVVAASSAAAADAATAADTREQRLRLENAKLKAEIERLRGTPGKSAADGVASPPCSASAGAMQTNSRSPPLHDHDGGFLRHDDDKPRILELATRALDELVGMCSSGEPVWVRGVETGRDILNYDEYVRLFRRDHGGSGDQMAGWSVEASRECGLVYLDTMQLVHAFMDVDKWKDLFPTMISKAATLEMISNREDDGRDGVLQLMYAELQTLTPMVPTRELYFARYCKKLAAERWAIVDVSFDESETGVHASSAVRCWKNPSGCLIEEQNNGRCKMTWVEHTRCRRCTVAPLYRAVTASGVAFGARRWVAALQLQCERMVFAVATNVPTRDSTGVSTLAGRRSVLKLAHRMTSSLCRTTGGSRDMAWRRAPKGGSGGGGDDDIWLTSRENAGDDPGEPQGLIACAAASTWLPVNPTALLDLLRDESRRPEWDVMVPGKSVQSSVNLAKGKDRTNCVTAYVARPEEEEESGGKWVLQDVCTNPCESTIAYAAIDAAALQPVIAGHDSSGVHLLPCGFISVMPDGLESKPAVITASRSTGGEASGAGSLVTVAFQVPASSAAKATLSADSVEAVTGLVSSTLRNIRKALWCDSCEEEL